MTFGICFKIMTIVESESWAHGGLLYHVFEISILKKVLKKIGDNYIEDPVCQMYSKEQKGVS